MAEAEARPHRTPMERIIRFAGGVTRDLAAAQGGDPIRRRALRASLRQLERDARLTVDVMMAEGRGAERHLAAIGCHLIGRATRDPADRKTIAEAADDLERVAALMAAVGAGPLQEA